ncbi:IclR family transcriptional regulator [Pseudochelatococcus contaminans]|uniref:IclR family transcriptional regulator n=1 Tax=Pseudochelatococcus contaminans TaxID=1538103 RepID=UPI0031B5B348
MKISDKDTDAIDETIDDQSENNDAQPADLINKSVIKAVTILNELGRHPTGISVTELAKIVRMSRPTVFRLLLSLEQTGFVEREENKYTLGWKVARLGRLADPHGGIIARVQPALRQLADTFNEMIGYAVYNGDGEFDLIAEAHASRMVTVQGYLGTDFPLHATATSKIALSNLTDKEIISRLPKKLTRYASATIVDHDKFLQNIHEIRKLGYAIIDDELEESLFSLAVPVRDRRDNIIGILSVSGPSERMRQRPAGDIARELSAGSHAIVQALSTK